MFIYLFIFLMSVSFTALAEYSLRHKSPFLFCFSSLCAITLPVLLAAFRDPGVGTDTLAYVDTTWNKILQVEGWSDFWNQYVEGDFDDIEFIYLLINYLASCLGKNVQWLYFITNLCVIIPVYMAAYDYRKQTPMWLVMCMFLLLYYNTSLNLVRQAIALSFCIYSYKFLEKRDWKKVVLWEILILSMHNTGIFNGVFIISHLLFSIKNKHLKRIICFWIFCCLFIVLFYFDTLLYQIISWNILPIKYLYYLSDFNDTGLSRSSLFTYLILLFCFIFVSSYLSRKKKQKPEIVSEYIQMKVLGTILFTTSLISQWAFRVSYYFNYPIDCICLPKAIYLIKNKNKSIYHFLLFVLITLLVVCWYWLTVIVQMNEVYPYKSKILGI